MSALLSSWAEEKEYKTGHNEKNELKSILTNTIRGYILCVVRYGMGVYERGTVFNRVRQVPCVAANIRFDLSQASPLRGCDDPFYLRKTYKSLKTKKYSEYYKKIKIMFDKIENI